MKTFVRSTVIAGILAMAANTMLVAQTSNSQFEQWYRAKYGRPSPTEQARLNTPQGSASPTTATPIPASVSASAGFEQWYLAKFGRPSPAQEARLQNPQVNSTSPLAAEPTATAATNHVTANTPAEHQCLAQIYRNQAQGYLAQARQHEAMLAAYKANPGLVNDKTQPATVNHCQFFVAKFKALAANSRELANLHEHMASDTPLRLVPNGR